MRPNLLLLSLLPALALVPTASAGGPDCVQVYPWSELCDGDVGGFADAILPDEVCVARLHVCASIELCTLERDCIVLGPIFDPVCPGGPPCPSDP